MTGGVAGWLRALGGRGWSETATSDRPAANASPAEPRFEPVARRDELPPGARKRVEVAGQAVLLLNVAGTLYAVPNTCPHRNWPLSEASEHAGVLKCVRHGWEFDVPSGRGVWPPFGYCLRHLPLRVEGDVVQVAWTEPDAELAH